MKKNIVVCVCLFILTIPVFGQAIDKAKYTAIDPFDYRLDEDKVRMGAVRKYKSVVEFISVVNQVGNPSYYLFSSLDKHTLLPLPPRSGMKPPSPGQTVTIYYTVSKGRTGEDVRVLDAYEDNRNKDEKGLGVVKSAILPSTPNLKKSDYETITADDYRDDAFFTQEGDDDRKFKSNLLFMSQDGILFKFARPGNPAEELATISMRVKRRFPPLTPGQRMTVYFTATKEDRKDNLVLDDIEVVK